MKKYFVFAIAALAALASCSKVEISAPEVQNPIGFNVASVMNGTKAGALTSTTLQDPAGNWQTIQAFARYTSATSQTFFGETGVSYSYMTDRTDPKNNDWHGTAKNYYWPTTGTMKFAAISPAALSGATYGSTYDGADIKTLTLTGVKNATIASGKYSTTASQDPIYVSDQQDILFSDMTGALNCADANVTGKDVALKFHHALAQVVINAKEKDAATDVKIQSITLKGVKVTGDLTVTAAATSTAAWSNTAAVNLALGTITAKTGTNEISATAYEQVVAEALLIPSAPAVAEVVYTYNNGVATITVTQDVELTTTNITSWDMGHKYVYNLLIGLDEITFSATVDTWKVTGPVSDSIEIEA